MSDIRLFTTLLGRAFGRAFLSKANNDQGECGRKSTLFLYLNDNGTTKKIKIKDKNLISKNDQ